MLKPIVESCLWGRYRVSGESELEESTHIIAQSFGTYTDNGVPGRINTLLAIRAQELAGRYKVPVIAQEEVAAGFDEDFKHLAVFGSPSSTQGGGLDSWQLLQISVGLAKEQLVIDRPRPIIVAQAYHIGRIAAQASKIGMETLLPPDMPREFAIDSKQWWTRSHVAWATRELAGISVLKLRGRI